VSTILFLLLLAATWISASAADSPPERWVGSWATSQQGLDAGSSLAPEGAYQQMIVRGHAHEIRVVGGTILPFGGTVYYHPNAANESDRQRINAWIRAPGHFDAVIDFDKAMADPIRPDHLRPEFDSGDHLHPSPAGFRAMAEAVRLGQLP